MAVLKLHSGFRFPAIAVFLVARIGVAGSGLYSGLGVDESLLFSLLGRAGWLWAIGWWLTDDLGRRGESWIYCPGLFVQMTWPFSFPYYLLKTRGWQALITIAIFIALWIAAAVIGGVIGLVLSSY